MIVGFGFLIIIFSKEDETTGKFQVTEQHVQAILFQLNTI